MKYDSKQLHDSLKTVIKYILIGLHPDIKTFIYLQMSTFYYGFIPLTIFLEHS